MRIALAWTAIAAAVAAVVASLAILVTGCAHAPRGHVEARGDHDRVCAGDVCYQVGELGAAWQHVRTEQGAVGFYNPQLGGVIEANATCRDDADAAPLRALTRQLLIGYTERHIEEQKTVPLDEREALRTRVSAKLDGVPMTLELYVMKRNGCIFDLSYAAPPDAFGRGADDFQRFVDGFADVRDASDHNEQASRGGR